MASVLIDKGVDVISVVGNGDARRRVSCVGGCGGGGEAAAGSVISCPSSSSSSQQRTSSGSPTTKDVLAMAQRVATKPLPISRSDLWGLLTAVSDRARKRPQGFHIMLHSSEHLLGRIVKEASCQFESPNVSARHCAIYRKLLGPDGQNVPSNHIQGPGDRLVACIKDFSSNGTYINQRRLQRNGDEAELVHGDVISLLGAPENDNAFAFVYREVLGPTNGTGPSSSCHPHKRKGSSAEDAEEGVCGDGKRIRGLGSGVHDGPISFSDVQQLQRANDELQEELKAHVLTIEKLQAEYHLAEERHALEMKEVRTSITKKFLSQLDEMQTMLTQREKELEASAAVCGHQQSTLEELKQQLAFATQSQLEAEDVINSQRTTIQELEKVLEDEQMQHMKERAEAEGSLREELERVRNEALEELNSHKEAVSSMRMQQEDLLVLLKDAEKEHQLVSEGLQMKLVSEKAAVKAVECEKQELEAQLQEEKKSKENALKVTAELEKKLQQVCEELEDEKGASRRAQAQISGLKLEMEASTMNLTLEKQQLQSAQERIMLRESELRAFHATAAEIAALQERQQSQLAMLLRNLDEGNSDRTKFQENMLGTSTRPRAQQGASDLAGMQNREASRDEQRGASQSRSASQPMQVDTDAQSSHKMVPNRCTNNDSQPHEDEQAKGTVIGDCIVADTQYDDSVVAPTLPGSLGNSTHPRESTDPGDLGDTISSKQGAHLSTTNVEAGYTQLVDTEGLHSLPEKGADALDMMEQHRAGAREENQVSPVNMDEGSTDEQQQPEMPAGETRQSSSKWNATLRAGDVDDTRTIGAQALISLRDTEGGLNVLESRSLHSRRNSMCTADLLASEVAGSWAVSTPASAHGENESMPSNGRGSTKKVIRRTSDESDTKDYVASQVATSDLGGKSWIRGVPASEEKRPVLGADANVNVNVEDLSQTNPRCSAQILVPCISEEHEALSEMLNIVAPEFGNRNCQGRREEDSEEEGSSCMDDSSKETDDDNEEEKSREEANVEVSVGSIPCSSTSP
ncbi:hypothetical protein CY35_09G078500 [Sphagnum magellanicum]|nr:hypothetical protein CY35_09G078500 [Sphagnum magellanicum]